MKKVDEHKSRLNKTIDSKIVTTMIGALAAVEEGFASVWDQDHADLFQEVRKKILDLGNQQKRKIAEDLDNYDVKWNKFSITMPVISRRDRNE
jgi:hypothetical protein